MKLHGALNSPYVRMCMVTALEAGLKDRITLVPADLSFVKADPKLEKLSAIGKIPVLETEHGHGLHDSRVIMEYLCHTAGNKSFLPDDGVKRFRILTLLALAQGLSDATVSLRVETAARPQGLQWTALIDRLSFRIYACLDDLEQNWMHELESINLGSIAAACALGYIDFRMSHMEWRKGRPQLSNFAESFNSRASMIAAALPAA
jgi:glutathione S-transferase